MARPTVKLQLDLTTFDEAPFVAALERCEAEGLRFANLQSLGDTPDHRRELYELNKTCAEDIPGRGPFYDFDDYCKARFERQSYNAEGVIIALDKSVWVGFTVLSDWSEKGFVFNEMTGVLPDYRRRGVATAIKLLGIRFAIGLGAKTIFTLHHAKNTSAIEMNRHLGFVDTDWETAAPA